MPWEKNGTPNTLKVISDTLTISDLTAEQNNVILSHNIADSLVPQGNIQLGSGTIDTGTNYAHRRRRNGTADVTATSTTNIGFETFTGANSSSFGYAYIVNPTTQEKLTISENVMASVTGAGTAPNRQVTVGKWADTTNQFDNVQIINTNSGDFAVDSNLSVLSDVIPIPETIGGWVELGRTTLGSAGDTISVSGLSNKRYYMTLENHTNTGGTLNGGWRFNADSATNYSYREQVDGGADNTITSVNRLPADFGAATEHGFQVNYLANLAVNEKLNIGHIVFANATGAGTAPVRREDVGKWVNTVDPVDEISMVNVAGAGSYDTGSEVVVLGWDPTDTHTNNFWEELDSFSFVSGSSISSNTFTAKKYLWFQGHYTVDSTNGNDRLRFNSDSGTNYNIRSSINGASDGTDLSTTFAFVRVQGNQSQSVFFNTFIINVSAEEKLLITHNVYENAAGAGNAPIREEIVCKWTNTSSQITSMEIFRSAGNFTSGDFKVWGSD